MYFTPDVVAEDLEGVTWAPYVLAYTNYGVPFKYDAENWGEIEFFLEVFMRAISGTAYARLYNVTDGQPVTNSEVSTALATMQRLRSVALTLVDGKIYRVQFGKSGADQGAFLGGKLIAD